MSLFIFLLVVLSFSEKINWVRSTQYYFPDDFLLGLATSAYQCEGAWNVNGRGETIWDTLVQNYSEYIADGSSGDIACDSYYKYKEDVKLLKELNADVYRLSISWARILPEGHSYYINYEGIHHYNKVINYVLSQNLSVMVTLYHFDLPQKLEDQGGFLNPNLKHWFAAYARVAFEHFGDRVKHWITFNEPYQICVWGYGDVLAAPLLNMSGTANYVCGHNLIKAHAAAYHLYNNEFRDTCDGQVGLTANTEWYFPVTSEDEEAAERMRQFYFGMFFHPIYSSEGDYPAIIKERVANLSALQGFEISRLPEFTAEEIEYIRGTYDFLGLNHYTSRMIQNKDDDSLEVSFSNDCGVNMYFNESWPVDGTGFIAIVPSGLRAVLSWVKEQYNDPEIYITESGSSDTGEIDDYQRVTYFKEYMQAVLESLHEDGVNIKSYVAWALMDVFEWLHGYKYRFGIHYVNFTDPNRERIPKLSAQFFKEVLHNRTIIH